MEDKKIKIRKKNGSLENFNSNKIINATAKSAERVMIKMTDEEKDKLISIIISNIEKDEKTIVSVPDMHKYVEIALDEINPKISKSYRDYRNYKIDFLSIVDKAYQKQQALEFMGDKSNANTDSSLVSSKRVIVYNEFNTLLFEKFNLTIEEREAAEKGFIYVHDKSSRRDTFNCSLLDVEEIFNGGFEMGNMRYNEPTTIDKAGDILGDTIASICAQEYGK